MAKSPYEMWKEDKARRDQGQYSSFREASKASRIQYTLPQYTSRSEKSDNNLKWEKDLLSGVKGKSNNAKFEKVTKSLGMSSSEAQEFRKFLDFQEDSKKEYTTNKDGSLRKGQSRHMGQGAKTQADLMTSINKTSNDRAKKQIELNKKLANQKPEKSFLDKTKDAAFKGLEILDRPFDALRTGIKEKVEGDSFWKGAKDGFTGKKDTSGVELNRALGFDREKSPTAAILTGLLGHSVKNALHLKQNDIGKLGEESAGIVTESVLDPTLLLGGASTKALKLLKAGKTTSEVAKELNVSEDVVKEFVKGTLPGQEIVDPNVLRIDSPKEDPFRFLNGPMKNDEVLGLNEPLYKRTVEGLGKEVKVKGTPQLNAPRHSPIGTNEIEGITSELDNVFKRRQAEEDAFVRSEMKPFDDMLERSGQADLEWQTSVKQAKEMRKRILDNYGPIIVPEGNFVDWFHHVPVAFRASRGSTKGIDLYKFADEEGFSSVDEAVQFLKQLDQTSKTKLKDLKPVDDMKINEGQYSELENTARRKFQETDTAKGLDQMFEELNSMLKQYNETSATAEPLSFMQQKLFTRKKPVSYVGKMDPKDQKAVRSEGGYSTRARDDGSLEITPEQPLEFKTQAESKPFKTTIQKEVNRKDMAEVVSEKKVVNNSPKSNPFGVDKETPFGIKAGTIDPYADSPIAGTESLKSKIESGKVSLNSTKQKLKTQLSSDVQPFYDIEKDLVKAENSHILNILPDKTLSAKDSLYKSLRGVRRATKAATHSIEKTYKPLLIKLEKAGIQRKEFEEYALAKHAQDIYTNNRDKMVRAGEVHQELEDIQNLVLNTNDKVKLKELADQEKALLKELDDLDPYILPSSATPEWTAKTLQKWQGNSTMSEVQKAFVKEQQKDIDMLVESGRFTRGEAEMMKKDHPNYVSMRRNKEDYDPLVRVGQRRRTGSEEQIMSPIDSAYMNRIVTFQNAAENLAKRKIEKLAQVDGAEKYFKKINPETATENQMRNSISFYKNGEQHYYELPQTLKNAYDNLKLKDADSVITKALSSIADITRKGSTHYNLDFIIKSVVRESQTPLLTSRTGLHPGEMVLGFLDSFMGEGLEKLTGGKFKSYRSMYKDLGGHSSGFITMDYTSVNKVTKAMKKGSLGRGWDIVNPLKNIERLGAAVEHAPKLAEFRSAKNKGYDGMDAMFEAMDVFDHADAGTAVREINKTVPYVNAAIRGNVRILQQMTKSPKDAAKFFAKGTMYVTLPTLGLYATRFAPGVSEDQRSRLRNMPEWKKNMFWHVPVPDSDKILAIPKAHLVAQIFANPVERVLDAVYDDSNKSGKEMAKDTGMDMLKSLTPPNAIAGVSQVTGAIANYDWFMGMPIEDSAMKREKPEDRYNMYTSELAKSVGGAVNVSPAKLDYVMKGLTGGVGRDVLDFTDNLLAQDGSRPAKFNSNAQIANPFKQTFDDKTGSSGVYDRLYKIKDDNAEAEGYYNAMRDLNKLIKEARESKELTSKEKREQIEDLRQQQRDIGDEVLSLGLLKK